MNRALGVPTLGLAGAGAAPAAVTYLIDRTGNLRARYRGVKLNPTNMILHLNALANDVH